MNGTRMLHVSEMSSVLSEMSSVLSEPCLNVQLDVIIRRKYKNSRYTKHAGHTEWVRHGKLCSIREVTNNINK